MTGDEFRQRIHDLMTQARSDLERMVSIPSVADPQQFPKENCLEMASFVRDMISDAGIKESQLIDMPDGHPAVYGHTPGPDGAPTILLYCHYDVQPPLDQSAWLTPPFELKERDDGRWYGRGAADCKGNIAMLLTALRVFEGDFPVGIKFLAEGAEEQNTGGLEEWVPTARAMLDADVILMCDTGNFAMGVPTLTTTLRGIANATISVRTLESNIHSGMFGGPAPDALVALIKILSTLHDENGNTTVSGLDNSQSWPGVDYSKDQFRRDAQIVDGVELIGSSVAEMLWARPSVNVLGIDCPPVTGSTASLQAEAKARVSLRVPPGMSAANALDSLTKHLQSVAPWNIKANIETENPGEPFQAKTDGPAYGAMADSMFHSYGRTMTTEGQGGSIPLCNVFAQTYPRAEIMLLGVEEPKCLIHAPNESVSPTEIEHLALSTALFLEQMATTPR